MSPDFHRDTRRITSAFQTGDWARRIRWSGGSTIPSIAVEGHVSRAQSVKASWGSSNIFKSMDFWTPNLNILRARGYFNKRRIGSELVKAIRIAAAEQFYWPEAESCRQQAEARAIVF